MASSGADNGRTPGRSWVKFDPTVNTGHIITAITISIGILGAYFDLRAGLRQEALLRERLEIELSRDRVRTEQALLRIESGLSQLSGRIDRMVEGRPGR